MRLIVLKACIKRRNNHNCCKPLPITLNTTLHNFCWMRISLLNHKAKILHLLSYLIILPFLGLYNRRWLFIIWLGFFRCNPKKLLAWWHFTVSISGARLDTFPCILLPAFLHHFSIFSIKTLFPKQFLPCSFGHLGRSFLKCSILPAK